MPHPNERVELAIQILKCRRKLQRADCDLAEVKRLREQLERLETLLRQIDE
jgi:hypothetical protein